MSFYINGLAVETAVTPVLEQWRYVFLTLTHIYTLLCNKSGRKTELSAIPYLLITTIRCSYTDINPKKLDTTIIYIHITSYSTMLSTRFMCCPLWLNGTSYMAQSMFAKSYPFTLCLTSQKYFCIFSNFFISNLVHRFKDGHRQIVHSSLLCYHVVVGSISHM